MIPDLVMVLMVPAVIMVIKEIGLDRTYLVYFLFSPMIERPQMTPYLKKFYLMRS